LSVWLRDFRRSYGVSAGTFSLSVTGWRPKRSSSRLLFLRHERGDTVNVVK
jgi:hypothetical protein